MAYRASHDFKMPLDFVTAAGGLLRVKPAKRKKKRLANKVIAGRPSAGELQCPW